jgi:hypothetical protein
MNDPSGVENCHLILSFLVFGTMLNGIASIPGYSATAFGWPHLITYANAIQAIFIIPLVIGLVYWLQGLGAAIAWVVLNATYVIFMVPIYFRRYLREEQGKWYLRDVAAPTVATYSICLLSLSIAPALQSGWAISSWLAATGMMAIIVSGLTLPHVRRLAYSWYYTQPIQVDR